MLSNISRKANMAVTEGLRNFKNDQKGVTAIEYGLIAIAVAVLIVSVFYGNTGFIKTLQGKFDNLTTTISSAVVTTGTGGTGTNSSSTTPGTNQQ
ncbi:Flp family type IVb pilin [Lonepinella sp. MS14435]|uniref:Flp family type IVb pilin n=1 Tax=Lonepinella sp. MS14435 TaxID=3003618 RepID=UPI0036D8171A